jgi:hypothetical protein
MGSKSDGGASGLRASARVNIDKAVKALEGIQLPDTLKMELALKYPDLILSSPEEKLGDTALALIDEDPQLKDIQDRVMEEQLERGEVGYTAEDRAKYEGLRRTAAQDEKARTASMLQKFAETGQLGGGSELAARLSSSQAATDRMSRGGMELGAEMAKARREALGQAGQTATARSAEDYRRQANMGTQRDAIGRFNAAVASGDTAARRQQQAQQLNIQNKQQEYNKQLSQQQFENEMAKQRAIAGAHTGQANMLTAQAGQMSGSPSKMAGGLAGAASGAGVGSKIDGAYGAGIGAGVGFLGGMMAEEGGIKQGDKKEKTDEEKKDEKLGKNIVKGLKGLADVISPKEEKKSIPKYDPVSIGPDIPLKRVLPKIELPMIEAKDGAYRKMGYEEGGMTEGRIVPGENYAGDELPDRINSGEMVINIDQQERLNKLLQELKEKRRLDNRLDNGEVESNDDQQELLMDVLRGDQPVEAIGEGNIVEENEPEMEREEDFQLKELMSMLKGNEYKCGGRKYEKGGIEGEPLEEDDLPDFDISEDTQFDMGNIAEGILDEELVESPEPLIDPRFAARPKQSTFDSPKEEEKEPEISDADSISTGSSLDLEPYSQETKQEMIDLGDENITDLQTDTNLMLKKLLADYNKNTEERGDQHVGASIADALGTFSNIINRGQPEGGYQVPVGALDRVGKMQDTRRKETGDLISKIKSQELLDQYRMANLGIKSKAEESKAKKRLADVDVKKEANRIRGMKLKDTKDYRSKVIDLRKESNQLTKERDSVNEDYKKSLMEYNKENNVIKKEQARAKLEQSKTRLNRLNRKDIYGIVKDFEKDPVIKDLKSRGVSFNDVDDLITSMEEGNEMALSPLGVRTAKAMGEVGVLTDADVKRYIEAQPLIRNVQDKFGRIMWGQLSEDSARDLKEIYSKMRSRATKERNKIQDTYINYAYNNFGSDIGMSMDEVKKRFNLGSSKQRKPLKPGNVRIQYKSKDGNIKYLTAPKENAEAVLEKIKDKDPMIVE